MFLTQHSRLDGVKNRSLTPPPCCHELPLSSGSQNGPSFNRMSQRRKRIVALLLFAIATPTLCLQSHRRPCHQQSWTRTSVTSLKAWSLPSPPTHTFRSLDWYQEIKNPCRAPNTPVRKDYEDDDEDSYYLSQEMLLEWKHEAEREQPRVARWSRVARFTRRVFTLFS